tara:strand:- start:116 stop:361 length:246 start_codon:yes stop_codon:yes gene_type:complete
MKHDIYKLRREAKAVNDRSVKTIVVQYVSAITGIGQADVIKNADKIKLSDILDAQIKEQKLDLDWEIWRDLQLAIDDANLT